VTQEDSNPEEKSTSGRFAQETHPRKSGMVPIEEETPEDGQPNSYQQVPSKKNAVGPIPTAKEDDNMAAMLLPDPGTHDNQVYAGFNHCYGTCCLWMYCPCNVLCQGDSGQDVRITEGQLGMLTELGRFHSMMKPGTYYINRMAYEFTRVDMRTQTFRNTFPLNPKPVCATNSYQTTTLT
jgi:hypothetical protein